MTQTDFDPKELLEGIDLGLRKNFIEVVAKIHASNRHAAPPGQLFPQIEVVSSTQYPEDGTKWTVVLNVNSKRIVYNIEETGDGHVIFF